MSTLYLAINLVEDVHTQVKEIINALSIADNTILELRTSIRSSENDGVFQETHELLSRALMEISAYDPRVEREEWLSEQKDPG